MTGPTRPTGKKVMTIMMNANRGLRFRTKLALWYVGVFFAFFIALEIYSYYELRAVLFESLDAALSAEADRAAEDVDIGSGSLFAQSGDAPRPPISAAAAAFSLRVIDARGRVMGSHNAFPSIAGEAGPSAGFRTVVAGGHRYRLVTRDVPAAPLGAYFIQAAHPLDSIEAELSAALVRFFITLPVVLALAALGGIFLATTALKPVRRLTRIAESIRGDRLALRARHEGPDDEIGRLALAFDGMLDRLEASFLRERRFTADASHELRTPLAALKGGFEVTLSRPRSAEEYETALRSMKIQVDRLVSLSADLLLLARTGQSALKEDEGGVELDLLLDTCAEGLGDLFASRRLSLARDFEAGIVAIGSRDHIARLLMNLLENAGKYADEGGSIGLSLRRDGDKALVTVRNTGPGIGEGDLAHVFEPFYRSDGARSRRTGGAGLGLAIAREIAEAHGGSLSLASVEGVETVATLSLPIMRKKSG